ncbi:MAG: polysaccharide deacetylase family protein [Clostridia bacterium]|nr:polysaccharide deacetylase family protein [Clostridia bacterium]
MKKVFIVLMIMLFTGAVDASAAELPVLMYHSVDYTGGMYAVTPEKLESDIKELHANGYTTVSFDEVIDYVYGNGTLPEKSVVITFDDGYENNCTTLLPLAEKLGFKYEVFTVAGFIHYGEYAMEWNQVNKVLNSPYAGIGCHTYNLHSYIGDGRWGIVRKEGENFREWENIIRHDLSMAKILFMDNTGYSPNTFAYPFGNFSPEADRILREEGYLVTVTTEPGINVIEKGDAESLYLMMRISMDGQTASALEMINGCKDKTYNQSIADAKSKVWSERNVSRRYALAALYEKKFKDKPYDMKYVMPYTDLKYEAESTKILFARCIGNNIIAGFPDWTMRPGNYITRGEFAVLLARCTGYDGRGVTHYFADSAAWNDWALSWCYEKGYMIGYGESFGVNDFLTKEQINLVIERVGL